jgi:hypothetical protein
MSHNYNFYAYANLGFSNEYHNKTGYCANNNYNNNLNNKNNSQQMYSYSNNRDNRLLTANDIYLNGQYNLNFGQVNTPGANSSSVNFLDSNEAKPRKNEDPFSNLISFK